MVVLSGTKGPPRVVINVGTYLVLMNVSFPYLGPVIYVANIIYYFMYFVLQNTYS